MTIQVEPLESRVLFTATAVQVSKAIHGMKTDEAKLRVALNGLSKQLAKGQKLITTDLSKLGVSTAQASLIQSFSTASSNLTTDLNNSANTFSPLINAEDVKLSGMVATLRKNPGDANQKQLINVEQGALTVYSEESMVPFMANYNPPPVVADSLTAISAANASSSKVAKDAKSIEQSVAKAMSKSYFAAARIFDNDIGNFLYLIDR